MGKKINSDPQALLQQSGSNKNSLSYLTLIIASGSLFFTMLTFLLGSNIIFRIYEALKQTGDPGPTLIEGIIAILNICLAAFVLLDLNFIHPVSVGENKTHASKSFKQLLFGWNLLWGIWILLYTCLALLWLGVFKGDKGLEFIFSSLADLFNMVNGFFFFYLFFVLDQPSVVGEKEQRNETMEGEDIIPFYRSFTVALIIGCAALIISLLVSSWNFSHEDSKVSETATRLVSVYTAVGMAFFFGRLDSHYLHISRVVMAPLYLYAVIQLFWSPGIFNTSVRSDERIEIFSIAFVLKIVIFVLVSKGLKDGTFNKYLIDARKGFNKWDD